MIHPTAIIYPGVVIGKNVYIGEYCIIGSPPEWKGHEDKSKGVIIGDNVRITGLVTIDAGAGKPTEIQDGCYIMKHAHVGHDAVIGKEVTISCGAKIGGHTVVGDYCNIGLNAVLHQKVFIPMGCMIGACAFIGKKTELNPFRKYAGVPAKDIGSNESSRHISELPS